MFELPPPHPILVHFPVAMLPVALLFDLLARLTKRASLAPTGWWCLLVASVISPLTAASGWLWLRRMGGDMDHPLMTIHQWLGTAIPLLLIPLSIWRYRSHARGALAPKAYIASLAVLFAAVTVQAHLGGMMSFGAYDEPPPTPRASLPAMDGIIGMSGGDSAPATTTAPREAAQSRASTAPALKASEPADADGWSDTIHLKKDSPQ